MANVSSILLPPAVGTLRLEYFSPLFALALFAVLGGVIVLLGIRSLAGLGNVRKWVAIGIRLAVLLLVILILGNAKWIRKNTDVELMVVRDISRSTELVHDFPGNQLQKAIDDYVLTATKADHSKERLPGDKVGEISFNERAYIDAIPSDRLLLETRAVRGAGTGTDAASAIQLALATMDSDSMHRLLLVWDGNQTAGDLNSALAAATSQHVPIDVVPLRYNVTHEVMMDKFIAPTWRQEGQAFSLEVHLTSTNATEVTGNLSVTNNTILMPLDSKGNTTRRITLKPGKNVERIDVPAQSQGVHQFHATVSGISNVTAEVGGQSQPGATQLDNKSADIFTFVKGKGQVLLVDNMDPTRKDDCSKYLLDALASDQITVKKIYPEEFPSNPIALQAYDAVILANVPHGDVSIAQETSLVQYIHDTGGGLVMIGGKDTFGAGGWQGSPLEKELPVLMEVPAQRQIPKGALVLDMDSAEAPEGNYWGGQCAIKAMETLSSGDYIGVISYGWGGGNGSGSTWDVPLSPKGDGSKVMAAIKNWGLGDMPSFEESIRLAIDGDGTHPGLIASDAKQKHIICVTDDDPQMPSEETIKKCIDNNISISTITVFPHNSSNVAPGVVELAKRTGGKNYGPINSNPNQLPQIFIKEASIVKRTIILEDTNGISITLNPTTSELAKGLSAAQISNMPLYGMDLTGRKDNPLIQIPITAGAKNDPVLATWQAGLGKTAVFTGDSYNRWDANWVGTPMYNKFWTQVVRGVSRSPTSTDFETEITTDGDKGHITIHAEKEGNAFDNFVSFSGTIAGGPDLNSVAIRPVQTGPGTYETDFDASAPGNYICYLLYQRQDGSHGSLYAGTAVNGSPELRDLQSNDTILKQIAERTGGRVLEPFVTDSADLFTRQGLEISSSPKPIWDLLMPFLLALILIDVAARRIAWDWNSTKRMATAAGDYVRQFTQTVRKVENRQTLESLKRVRGEVAEQKFKPGTTDNKPPPLPMHGGMIPDPKAKFEAGAGVEGDISSVVGGATDKPIPSAPKKIEPKGGSSESYTGGLMAAKRRAQQQIKEKEDKR